MIEPAWTQHSPPTGICQHSHTQSSSREKVSKLTFWLWNYLFSYNCRFCCIIRMINIKLLLMRPHILNDAVRSQKRGSLGIIFLIFWVSFFWYPEKWGGERGRRVLCCRVRLDVLYKPRILPMTATVCHYTLQWHQGSSKLIFLLQNYLHIDSTTGLLVL